VGVAVELGVLPRSDRLPASAPLGGDGVFDLLPPFMLLLLLLLLLRRRRRRRRGWDDGLHAKTQKREREIACHLDNQNGLAKERAVPASEPAAVGRRGGRGKWGGERKKNQAYWRAKTGGSNNELQAIAFYWQQTETTGLAGRHELQCKGRGKNRGGDRLGKGRSEKRGGLFGSL